MARPRRHTDEALLAAAREVFLQEGVSAPLQRVADRAGLSQPALLRRFGSKDNIVLRALLPSDGFGWAERAFAGPDERPFPEQLDALAQGAMTFFAASIPALMALRAAGGDLRGAIDHAQPGAIEVRRALVAFFARARDRGLIRDADPERVAMMLVGSLQTRVLGQYLFGHTLHPDEHAVHARAVVDLMWNGLHPKQPQEPPCDR
jgi:AcrR family transcriptional regulator